MAVWSAATGLRASPTCAASPRQQEQQEAKWRRIRGGVERSDRKKRGGGISAASHAAGETIVTASTPVLTKSSRRYLNGKKLCENWKLFWEMPLQVAEAKPWFGQPPLSRAKDQNDRRVT